MRVQREMSSTTEDKTASADGAGKSNDLKSSLRGMSYDEGVKALSPNGTASGAPGPADMKDADKAGGMSAEASAAAASKIDGDAKPGAPKAPAKKGAPTGGGEVWYQMPVDAVGLPPEYESTVPVGQRHITQYTPDGGGAPVKVFTTKTDWVAVKIAIQNSRYQAAKNEADIANSNAANGMSGVASRKMIVVGGKADANGFATYRLELEQIPETDPYKLGFDTVSRQTFHQLQTFHWPNAEIQKLCNIQPGFSSAVPLVGKKGPVYRSEIKAGDPVPTKYAVKNRAQIYPQGWVAAWNDQTKTVD